MLVGLKILSKAQHKLTLFGMKFSRAKKMKLAFPYKQSSSYLSWIDHEKTGLEMMKHRRIISARIGQPSISVSGCLFVSSSQTPLRRKSAIGEFMIDRLEL